MTPTAMAPMRVRFSWTLRLLLALSTVAIWSLSMVVGPGAGRAFADAPVVPPITITSIEPVTAGAAATTGVAVTGAEAAAGTSALFPAAICTAAVACAVTAVALVGAAYGTYKLLHLSFGPKHDGTVKSYGGTSAYVTNYATAPAGVCASGDGWCLHIVGHVNGSGQVFMGVGWTSVSCPGAYQGGNGGSPCHIGSSLHYNGCDGYAGWHTLPIDVDCWESGSPAPTVKLTNGEQANGWGLFDGSCNCRDYADIPLQTTGTTLTHTVRIHQECLTPAGTVASTLDYSGPSFDDGAASVPDVQLQSCATGTIPGSYHIDETNSDGSPAQSVASSSGAQQPADNPCSVVGASCVPTLQRNLGSGWVTDPNTTPSTSLDGSFRCEWLGPGGSPDGGTVPMIDCVAASGSTNTATGPDTGVKSGTPDEQSCWSSGWGWNPVDWVLHPVKCALVWAFEPPPDYLAQKADQLKASFMASPPGVLIGSAVSVFTAFGSLSDSSDCAGPAFPLHYINDSFPDVYPIQACTGLGAQLHDALHPFILAIVWIAVLMACVQVVMWSFGLDWPW